MDLKFVLPGILLIAVLFGSFAVNQEDEITLYGRRSSSGTFLYFRNNVVENEYSASMYNMIGNDSIVEAVKNDKTGIGYVGVGYVVGDNGEPVDGIKILNIAKGENSEAVTPLNPQNVKTGKYPIARPLYQYTDGVPPQGSLIYNFLKFELSGEGEEIVTETGFYPVTPQDREQNENNFLKAEKGDSKNGNLNIKGSDTVLQLASNFAATYMETHPQTNITVEGGGSGTGIAALISGRTDIANSSREMSPEEISEAKNNGIDPVEFIIARDCISIIVNDNNPIENMTLQEISKIFSGEIKTWKELRN